MEPAGAFIPYIVLTILSFCFSCSISFFRKKSKRERERKKLLFLPGLFAPRAFSRAAAMLECAVHDEIKEWHVAVYYYRVKGTMILRTGEVLSDRIRYFLLIFEL